MKKDGVEKLITSFFSPSLVCGCYINWWCYAQTNNGRFLVELICRHMPPSEDFKL